MWWKGVCLIGCRVGCVVDRGDVCSKVWVISWKNVPLSGERAGGRRKD